MKSALRMVFLLMLCLTLVACSRTGKTDHAEIDYGKSTRFSQAEIKAAGEAVLEKFKDFRSCDLQGLWYDEDRSDPLVEVYLTYGRGSINGATQGNVVVLLSDFYVNSSGADPSFNPDTTYTNWQWVLTRTSSENPWTVDDWGIS